MNFLPAQSVSGAIEVSGTRLVALRELPDGALKLGIRPEYLRMAEAHAPGAVPATVTQVQDVGTHSMLSAKAGDTTLKARLSAETLPPTVGDTVWLKVLDAQTCYYRNEELV